MAVSSLMDRAMGLAAAAPTLEEKAEIVKTAVVLESRTNRFLVSWCLNYMKYNFVYLGKKSPDAPPRLRDRVFGVEVDDPGSGVAAAARTCEALVEWSSAGGVLALEHPDAGMEERHAAPCCELLARLSLPGPRPWSEDLLRWAMAHCPAEFDEFLPKGG